MSQANHPGCVLQAVQIKGHLQGLLGEIAIAQTYENAESTNIEAVFTFPVPAEAVLLGVEIRINDRQLQGRVLPKRQDLRRGIGADAVENHFRQVLPQHISFRGTVSAPQYLNGKMSWEE